MSHEFVGSISFSSVAMIELVPLRLGAKFKWNRYLRKAPKISKLIGSASSITSYTHLTLREITMSKDLLNETTIILPSSKHNLPKPPTVIPLHGLDLVPPIHIEIRHFFRIRGPASVFADTINNLKVALAEALEIYLPVAGTVLTQEDGQIYNSTDSTSIIGASFILDVKDESFVKETEELSPRSGAFLPPGSPIFAAKITQYTCGTVILTGSLNHQVADLAGYLDFVHLWATLARGEAVDFSSVPKDWQRTPKRFFEGLYTEQGVPNPPPGYMVLPKPPTESPTFAESAISYWRFTQDDIKRLKNNFSPPTNWISSGDALAALCWGAITRARNAAGIARSPLSDPDNEKLAMAADGRQRAPDDAMKGSYYGNFNLLIILPVPRSDLLLATPEAGSRAALRIRQAIGKQLQPKEIAHKIAFYEAPENAKPSGRIIWFGDVIMTNWCKFDLVGPKLDMGPGMGKPFHATAGGVIYPPGYVRMLQEGPSGDVVILVTVEVPAAEHLFADALMTKYAKMV
ncbi:hypothetical protein D9613_006576 [Agrocybe pediades]|uniref:Uncharacterized protein n=1 Tax=Agrocybe pediades TaxID=84607 RepID=A0A8H4QGE2_9AGAR|nr:hypothetical protein D9613_006576 [Agrocybe pediades]